MAVGGTVVHFTAVKSVIHSFAPLEFPSLRRPPFIFRNHASMHTVLGSFLHLNFLPLSSRVFQFIFFSSSQFLSKNEGCGEKTRNIDSFRVIYQIVLFFNRLFHVIFRVTFFINLSKEEISKKWNEIFQMLNRARNKIDLLSWKRYRNGFSIIRSWYNKFNQTPCKTAHFPVVPCIISLYLSFPHAQFAFDGSLFFRILIRRMDPQISSRSLSTPLSVRRCL